MASVYVDPQGLNTFVVYSYVNWAFVVSFLFLLENIYVDTIVMTSQIPPHIFVTTFCKKFAHVPLLWHFPICTHIYIMTFHIKNCTHLFMTFHNKNCTHIFIMTFHNNNEMEVQRSKVNFDVHAVDTFVQGLCVHANTGGSNSRVLGCSSAQSQARTPVEANYARRRCLLTDFYMYMHKHYVIIASCSSLILFTCWPSFFHAVMTLYFMTRIWIKFSYKLFNVCIHIPLGHLLNCWQT